MTKANIDIRQASQNAGVKLWEVAFALEMQDSNFSRKLRHELPQEEKTKIFAIIDKLETKRDREAV